MTVATLLITCVLFLLIGWTGVELQGHGAHHRGARLRRGVQRRHHLAGPEDRLPRRRHAAAAADRASSSASSRARSSSASRCCCSTRRTPRTSPPARNTPVELADGAPAREGSRRQGLPPALPARGRRERRSRAGGTSSTRTRPSRSPSSPASIPRIRASSPSAAAGREGQGPPAARAPRLRRRDRRGSRGRRRRAKASTARPTRSYARRGEGRHPGRRVPRRRQRRDRLHDGARRRSTGSTAPIPRHRDRASTSTACRRAATSSTRTAPIAYVANENWKFDAPKAQLFRLIIDGVLGGRLPVGPRARGRAARHHDGARRRVVAAVRRRPLPADLHVRRHLRGRHRALARRLEDEVEGGRGGVLARACSWPAV